MGKKFKLGIGIPYYNNHPNCEKGFKLLMECLINQLNKDTLL